MRNKYPIPAMKLFLFAFLALCQFSSFAQVSYTIGTGTATNSSTAYPTPFGDRYEGTRAQYLYTAADLTAAGMLPGRITAIKFNVASLNSTAGVHENYTISIGSTAVNSLSLSAWEPGTTVIWGPLDYQPVLGMNTFNLATPFNWDGTSNIIVEICHGDLNPSSSTITYTYNASVAYTTVTYTANHTYRADNVIGCGNTTTSQTGTETQRPNITFDVISCPEVTGLATNNVRATSAGISWAPVTGSAGYEYVLDNTSANPTGAGTPTTGTSYAAGPLSPSTTYYFHVRNKCSSTSYSIWKTISFTTDNDCQAPSNIAANITGVTSADISWDAITGSLGYEYVISNTATDPTGAGTPTSTNGFTATGLTANTTYYVHVRNKCGAPIASSRSNWKHIMFTTPQCLPTTSIDVVNITDNSADLIWSQVTSANRYTYVVNTTRANPVKAEGTTTTSFIVNLKLLMPGTKYYVHVRSECYVNDSSAWQLDSFVTKGSCNAPDVRLTKNGDSSINASWTELSSDYSYEYALKNSNVLPVNGIEIFTPNKSIVLPADNMPYYLHVRRKCKVTMQYSDWTTIMLRAANQTGIANTQAAEIKVYPNPVKDKLVIETGDAGKNAHVLLTNMSGQVLANIVINNATTEIDMTAYPTGVYFVKYTDTDKSEVVKISKQ